jgi:hypothetical protein
MDAAGLGNRRHADPGKVGIEVIDGGPHRRLRRLATRGWLDGDGDSI